MQGEDDITKNYGEHWSTVVLSKDYKKDIFSGFG